LASIIDYFSLWTAVPELGGRGAQGRVRQPLVFFGVLLGALAKVVYDWLTASQTSALSWQSFVVAAIAGLVAFPYIYEKAGLNRGQLTFAKWAVAFQNGFFWTVAMDAISKLHGQP
jgi:predicted membrane channel-forming protein YqfA (hemolysin III family)